MLSAKPHWPPNTAPEKLLPFPWGPAFLGAGRNLSLFRSHLFSSRVSPSMQQGMVSGGYIGTVATGMRWEWGGRAEGPVAQAEESGAGKGGEGYGEKQRGASKSQRLNNFISRTRTAGRPLRTAGLLLGCCRTVLWLMRHLLCLTVCICCRSPPPAKLPAAAAPGSPSLAARCVRPPTPALPRASPGPDPGTQLGGDNSAEGGEASRNTGQIKKTL